MEQRTLGRTGLQVSALGFGCGAVGGLMVRGEPAEQRRAVERAIASGITYFDTAPSYGDGRSEQNLGRVLAEIGAGAEHLVVGTKFRVDSIADGHANVARAIRASIEASLRRLGRERVHLLQLHTKIVPDSSGGPDGQGSTSAGGGGLTVEDVLGPVVDGLRAIREAGLAQFVGITATGDTAATRRVVASETIDTAQVFFNALNPSASRQARIGSSAMRSAPDFSGLMADAAAHNVGIIVIRPLAAGAVTGTPARHANAGGAGGVAGESYEDDLARAGALRALATELGLEGPVELALRFALSERRVATVLVGLSDYAQLEEAIRWAKRGPLSGDVVKRVLALSPAG